MAEDVLRKLVAEKEKSHDYDIKIEPITSDGGNFTAALYTVIISRKNQKDQRLFAKFATLSKNLREIMQADKLFQTEELFYTKIMTYFEEIQDKYNIPSTDRAVFPKYYASSEKYMEETMILEDLISQGYNILDRQEPADWEYASKAIEEIAKFHALSLACNQEKPEEISKIYEIVELKINSSLEGIFKGWHEIGAAAIDIAPERLKPSVTNFLNEMCTITQIEKCFGPAKKPLLIHGDFKRSNLMHKYQVSLFDHYVLCSYISRWVKVSARIVSIKIGFCQHAY